MRLLSFAAALLAVAAATAAPPDVAFPTAVADVRPGRILQLAPKGEFDQGRWRLQYGVTTDGRLVRPSDVDLVPVNGGKAAHFACVVPGEYVVLLTVWNKDGVSDAEVRVVVAGPGPAPGPGPDPVPPGPTAKRLYLAVVRESALSPKEAAVLGDTEFMNSVTAGGDWDAFDPKSPTAVAKGYVEQAKKVQDAGGGWAAACVLLDADSGRVLTVFKLPGTKDELKNRVQAYKSK